MTTIAHTLPSGRVVKLGRLKPKVKPRVVQLAKYLDRPRLLRGLPESVDYFTNAASSLSHMYANDRYGDCVVAGCMHQLGGFSANDRDAPKEIIASDAEVLRQYTSICGPGDNGCYIVDVLEAWRTKGLTAGGKVYKIDGYCSIDAADLVSLRTAIHLFGGALFGVDLPSAWLNTEDGDVWDVTRSGSVGGHCVPGLGYVKAQCVVSTWGGKRFLTFGALESRRYADECYVVLSPNWYNDDRLAPSGVNVDALKQALTDFANGILPDDPDPVPPTPIPPAPVPVPPSPSGAITVTLPGFTFKAAEAIGQVDNGQVNTWEGSIEADGPILITGGATVEPRGKLDWNAILAILLQLLPLIFSNPAARAAVDEFVAKYGPAGTKLPWPD